MSNTKLNIAIAEKSELVTSGLTIMLNSIGASVACVVSDIGELRHYFNKVSIYVVFVNPVLLINKTEEFNKIRNEFVDISWIAINHSSVPIEQITAFAAEISIYISRVRLQQILSETVSKDNSVTYDTDTLLSERESEVLRFLAEGNSNKEIADIMNISIHTVITHRKNITQKTGIKSQSGLTIYAISKRIIDIKSI